MVERVFRPGFKSFILKFEQAIIHCLDYSIFDRIALDCCFSFLFFSLS